MLRNIINEQCEWKIKAQMFTIVVVLAGPKMPKIQKVQFTYEGY